jgi:fatty-acyl-CoA synthase
LIPNFWKIVEHYRLTFFSGVPAVFTKLLDVPIDADVSTLDYAICGAAPMPVEVFKNFEKATGLRILEGYGCTEGTCASSVNPLFGERRIGSIGLPFPYQEMRIARLDNEDQFERWAETEEIGSVLLRGPNVFAGYKDPGINAKAWVDSGDGKGLWFHTGDLGRQDAEGYFWLTGRKKELIIRGGHNIDPKMIEEPMHRHPAVAMAAAVGSPDPEVGEVPALFVQLKPGQQADPQELYEFAKANIPERAAIPKAIHIIDEMPVTNVGKTYKLPLHLGEIERVLRQEGLKTRRRFQGECKSQVRQKAWGGRSCQPGDQAGSGRERNEAASRTAARQVRPGV